MFRSMMLAGLVVVGNLLLIHAPAEGATPVAKRALVPAAPASAASAPEAAPHRVSPYTLANRRHAAEASAQSRSGLQQRRPHKVPRSGP
jgi:hypothetical protein